MRKMIYSLLLTLLLVSFSCKECEECFSPPPVFQFEMVDALNNENLFTNGTFDPADIEVIDLDNDQEREYQFIDENDLNYLLIGSVGWETEQVTLSIRVDQTEIFTLYVDAVRKTVDECCKTTQIKEFEIEGSDFEEDNNAGVYRIFVEL